MWRTNEGYTTSGSGTLYIKTEDDADWWTSSITDSQKITYNSYTKVGSTRSLSIDCNSKGQRTIKFYVKATSDVTDNIAFSTQTFSVTLDPNPVYKLSISAGTGSSITVNRTSCAGAGSTGNLTAGSNKLYYGDKLKITYKASANYGIDKHTVNSSTFTSGNTHTVTGNVSVASTAYALKSTVSATDANIGSTSSVIISRHSSSYTHTLTWATGSLSGTIATKTTETTVPWKVPTSIYAAIPSAKTATVTITCTTYNGSTSLGSNTCTMTATAAEANCGPSISVTAVDNNDNTIALTGSNKKIIKFHSDIAVTATPTAKAGTSSTIKSTTIKCGSASASGTSKTFTDAESVSISATTTDSRGYSKTESATGLTLINYVKLTATTTVKRTSPTADTVTITTKGNYYNGSFGAVANTLKMEVRYKPQSQEAYTSDNPYADMTVTISGNTYTAKATLSGLDYQNTYDIRVRASDAIYQYEGPLADAVYNNIKLSKGVPVFDWGESDFQFNVPARFRAIGDATGDSNGKVAIRTGPDEGQHIDIDTNEIIAKADASTLNTFSICGFQINLYANDNLSFVARETKNNSYVPIQMPNGYAIGATGAGVKLYFGKVTITPTAANETTSVTITLPSGMFTATPVILVSANTSVPEKVKTGYSDTSATSFKIYLNRTNTSATSVSYICIGS